MTTRPRITYLIEPRFPGGTSAAVASELAVARDAGHLAVNAFRSRMFGDRPVAPVLERQLVDLGLALDWGARTVSGDTVILHNPAFLKFEGDLPFRIVARRLIVVTHENFLRPGGREGFDVGGCLQRLTRASLCFERWLAPVSPLNRRTVADWLGANSEPGWGLWPDDWFNICDFDIIPPTDRPSDRRGRLSRPGAEKFPTLAALDACFPRHAEANVILGADLLLAAGMHRPHWQMFPFQGIEVERFFDMIDFMVHFTAPTWQESFGRVLAEGIAAGKVVISDPATAANFRGGVIGAQPSEVDRIVADLIADPASYAQQVRLAQGAIGEFSSGAFRSVLDGAVSLRGGAAA